ncbi:efflux RND transporter periplasmic adaptor subunit [Candidatus Accumulibacter sp. ACC003]|uniref:efflux RND transporter periplasmic adaptor subunit n=1 Tax=Candidatus Accumulibacter sp. ACC003 TaxID=2823334 RepID=UPI0025C0C7C7|nr:efflux RND transporter periplasmic adaptor subunit [Candidatus Accumulibacter sp. ACC003]
MIKDRRPGFPSCLRLPRWRTLLAALTSAVSLSVALPAQAQALPTVLVEAHPVDLTLPAEALVEAVKQATVAAQISGRVVVVQVDAGQAVRKGDLLMKIDAREASEAAAGAAALYVNARARYQRSLSLRQQGFVSQAAVDQAKADVDAAQAASGQSSVGVGHTNVLAPISGIVGERLTELGEMATPGKPLLTIHDPSGLRVTASIPQYRLAQLRRTERARVEFPELGKSIDGLSVTLLPTADAATHVSLVRVALPAGISDVVPGMHARVHFILGRASKLTVPQAAVVRRGAVAAVYVEKDDGTLGLRQLRLGETVGAGEVEVLAGLHSGERVVLDPVKAAVALKSSQPPSR